MTKPKNQRDELRRLAEAPAGHVVTSIASDEVEIYCSLAWYEFWKAASPQVVLQLLDRIDELENP